MLVAVARQIDTRAFDDLKDLSSENQLIALQQLFKEVEWRRDELREELEFFAAELGSQL